MCKSSHYCNNANFFQFYESSNFYKTLKLILNFENWKKYEIQNLENIENKRDRD